MTIIMNTKQTIFIFAIGMCVGMAITFSDLPVNYQHRYVTKNHVNKYHTYADIEKFNKKFNKKVDF